MSIRYYFSGFDKEYGFKKDISSFLLDDIKQTNRLVYIPSDFSKVEKIKRLSTGINSLFNKIGIFFEELIVLNENMSEKDMQDYISDADVVFLLGGNPNIQLNILNDYGLVDVIFSTQSIIIGLSAGAMCMSKYSLCLLVNDEYPVMDIKNAMNLSGISIYPHYNTNGEVTEIFDNGDGKTRKSDILKANQQCGDFYLLSDDSYIRECNGELTFIGDGIIYISDEKFKIIKPTERTN